MNKIYILLSNWGFPFGGGEEYMYQTAQWTKELGMKNYWICFSSANNKPYEKLEIIETEYFTMIKVPGGIQEKSVYNLLKLIKPDIVHHQGGFRKLFHDVCAKLRIQFISGIHFWTGIIKLNPETFNVNILENYEKHSPEPDLKQLIESKYCTLYTVSKFVDECIQKICHVKVDHLAYSGSSKKTCYIPNLDIFANKFVTIINIHKFKGGELAYYLLETLKDVSFILIKTEYGSEELDAKIADLIKWRNENAYAESYLYERTNNIKAIYEKTKIFLASSIVDETFCRTANEAMMNGIPVITTGQGNLKYFLNGTEFIIPIYEKEKWAKIIKKLYFNKEELYNARQIMLQRYEEFSEEKCKSMFIDILNHAINISKERNIMIFTPWCDQGLGIQSRNYYNILKSEYNMHIFGVKPYNANSCIELQKNPNEWLIDKIYYSKNDREHVTDIELIEFINKYNIGKFIIPETCWYRVFEIAKLLRSLDVKCYAVPNIEIVRRDEIYKHSYFYKILCNNHLCENLLNKHNLMQTEYIGYGIFDDKIIPKTKNIANIIKFLFIGGMNAFSRKHILEICEGFSLAYSENSNIQLTCTIQKTNLLEIEDQYKIKQYLNHPGITFIQEHLSYDKIIDLYYDSHISIQLSKHEGLGLGFYEALSTGTPVITLDVPPHNEIIINDVNGWLIPAYYKKMLDNPNSLIESAYFDPLYLKNKIIDISRIDLQPIYNSVIKDYNTRLNVEIFKQKFINSFN